MLSSVVLGRSEKEEEVDMNDRVERMANLDVVGLLEILETMLDVFKLTCRSAWLWKRLSRLHEQILAKRCSLFF